MKRTIGHLALGVMLIAALPSSFGGWAVVTFEDIPEYLVLNEPTTIAFEIRQHGVTLLDDRAPSVSINRTDGGFFSRLLDRNSVDATFDRATGHYRATITPTEPGELTLVVETDVFRWKTKLLPIPVIDAQMTVAPLPLTDRGRHLFAAKGCATCHAKRDDPAFADWQVVQVGPDLMGRTYPADWLAAKIADPERFAVPGSMDKMPNLNVDPSQISALVAYINGHLTATDTKTETSLNEM